MSHDRGRPISGRVAGQTLTPIPLTPPLGGRGGRDWGSALLSRPGGRFCRGQKPGRRSARWSASNQKISSRSETIFTVGGLT